MYDGVMTSIRTPGRETNNFSFDIGPYQGSALSRFLFIVVMDELTKEIQDDVP